MKASRVGIPVLVGLLTAGPVVAQSPVHYAVRTDAPQNPLARSALLHVADVPLDRALKELHRSSGVSLAFSSEEVAPYDGVTCPCREVSVARALEIMLRDTGLRPMELGGHVVLLPEPPAPSGTPLLASGVGAAVGPMVRTPVTGIARKVAQEVVVAGIVLDAQTQRPLAGAQIVVQGTDLGGIANASGRFRIQGVTGTQVTLEAIMLGYRTLTQVVQVGDVDIRLQLTESAIELDEIVVTGTAGGTLRRALGTTVAQIDAAEAVEVSPASNMQQLLSGRVSGMAVLPGSGNVGSGSATRVRGVSSITLANEPLIYIDGVRVNNDIEGGPNIRQGRQVNRLNDINPEDIESVEVIKGPAAATLFGTEASNGVIQIITKRGRSGAPTFGATVRQGATWLMDPAGKVPTVYSTNETTGALESVNLYENERAAGREVFQTGHNQTYDLNVQGGTDVLNYFVSGQWGRNEGVVDYNWQEEMSARANFGITPNDRFDIDANLGYVQSETRFAQAASGWGIWDQLVWGSPARLEPAPAASCG